ncbi:OLC1v1038286C4 [Oldenlandia corymbosa var. corymbosa]|uniref:OLC1v1038286C4 n=1 Tax=Oldenlandia corymbosa var. corymbosa TaxID=529605 RepID=A0AAV1CZE6_OLDCO|nr:OLC1v1038286C4 [Oldenlandia corymbosa var. corymbosa]
MAAMGEAAAGPPSPGKEDYSHLQIVPVSSSPPLQEKIDNQYDHRFQRSDRWLPVYSWLESLDTDDVVKSKDVLDWLTANPEIRERLYSRHSRYHLMHYIKKCHMKILKRKEKKLQNVTVHILSCSWDEETTKAPVLFQQIGNDLSSLPKDNDFYNSKQKEALEKYTLLVEFEKHLLNMISRRDT